MTPSNAELIALGKLLHSAGCPLRGGDQGYWRFVENDLSDNPDRVSLSTRNFYYIRLAEQHK